MSFSQGLRFEYKIKSILRLRLPDCHSQAGGVEDKFS